MFELGLGSSTAQVPSGLLHLPPPAPPFCPTLPPWRKAGMPCSCCRGKAHREGGLALLCQAQSSGQATSRVARCQGPCGAAPGSQGQCWRAAAPCPRPRAELITSRASWLCLLPAQSRAPRFPAELCLWRAVGAQEAQHLWALSAQSCKEAAAAAALCSEMHIHALSSACCLGSSEETLTASSNRLNAKSFSSSRHC